MTLWMSRTIRDGRTIGLMTLLGTNLGIAIHTLLVAFGVSALVVASPMAFLVLKTGGAAYLLWLAIQAVRNRSVLAVQSAGKRQASAGKAFLNGLWVNLLNPKVIIFFMTFLPQFVSVNDPQVTGKLIFSRRLVDPDRAAGRHRRRAWRQQPGGVAQAQAAGDADRRLCFRGGVFGVCGQDPADPEPLIRLRRQRQSRFLRARSAASGRHSGRSQASRPRPR